MELIVRNRKKVDIDAASPIFVVSHLSKKGIRTLDWK
jgi:hypothetical protein